MFHPLTLEGKEGGKINHHRAHPSAHNKECKSNSNQQTATNIKQQTFPKQIASSNHKENGVVGLSSSQLVH